MTSEFLKFIKKNQLFPNGAPVLLAVSGGADSTVLAELFYQTGQRFALAHCNFQLRGKESDDDEAFVKELAKQLKADLYIERFNTEKVASSRKISIQMAARELRYEWFEKIRKEQGFHFIATAHHRDDSIETVLLNLVKGTGIAGLHGILPKSSHIIRPLLFASREQIEAFALEHKLPYRTDSSNASTKYERNKIRLEVIPLLKTINPALEDSFASSIGHLQEAETLYNLSLERAIKKLLQPDKNHYRISIGVLKNLPARQTILYEALKPFQFNASTIEQVMDSLDAEAGKQFFSPTHRLLKDRTHLMLSPIETEEQTAYPLELKNQKIKLKHLTLEVSLVSPKTFSVPTDSAICCVDKEKLQPPLLLRPWKKGDYFYPLGMKSKKKKVSDYLVDRKIPLTEKEQIYVLESGDKIACIIGERIDERFKITPATKEIVVIQKG